MSPVNFFSLSLGLPRFRGERERERDDDVVVEVKVGGALKLLCSKHEKGTMKAVCGQYRESDVRAQPKKMGSVCEIMSFSFLFLGGINSVFINMEMGIGSNENPI